MRDILPDEVILAAVPRWSIADGLLTGSFLATSFASAAEFVAEVGRIADDLDHHPDIGLRYPGVVQITVTTHDAGGLTQLDIDLASAVATAAEERGLTRP